MIVGVAILWFAMFAIWCIVIECSDGKIKRGEVVGYTALAIFLVWIATACLLYVFDNGWYSLSHWKPHAAPVQIEGAKKVKNES
jgi:hypothetical protein